MALNPLQQHLNQTMLAYSGNDVDFELSFELLKQDLANSAPTVRRRKILNIVKKMQSLNYEGNFIQEYINRLKGIPVTSKKTDSTLSDYDPKDDSNQDSNNQDSNNQDSDNEDSDNQDANNQEDSRPIPIKSFKRSGYNDKTINKL